MNLSGNENKYAICKLLFRCVIASLAVINQGISHQQGCSIMAGVHEVQGTAACLTKTYECVNSSSYIASLLSGRFAGRLSLRGLKFDQRSAITSALISFER
jgi:hypothetical protein